MPALLDRAAAAVAEDGEAAMASLAADRLTAAESAREPAVLMLGDSAVPLPPSVLPLLRQVLRAVAARQPVSVIPHNAELTTQQAADFLNVSRPYLIGLLERGEIPFRLVGSHRRIDFGPLQEFRSRMKQTQRAALAEMQRLAQLHGFE